MRAAIADWEIPFASNAALILDPADPLRSARMFLAREGRALHHHGGVFYGYDDGLNTYLTTDEAEVRAWLYHFLESAQEQPTAKRSATDPQPFKPTKSKVENILDALRGSCNLPTSIAAPAWLAEHAGLDPYQILPFQNGLLHIPTRRLLPPTPAFFSVNGLPFDYDPAAEAPARWINFLAELWPDDLESRQALQEWIGYLLKPDTRYQKIAMLVGPKRSGKGTIARVTRKLLGDRNVVGPTLGNMSEQFGLSILIGKPAAIIADARISGRTDTAVVTERLLSISGEDTLSIPRKFLPDWTGKLPTRFTLLTNELPLRGVNYFCRSCCLS